ncbi:S8 family serine peptidase, partial [bacterium]|nr:S8 family serine peptidase [bacterium]
MAKLQYKTRIFHGSREKMNKLTETRTRQFEAASADFRAAFLYLGLVFVHLFRAVKHLAAGMFISFIFIALMPSEGLARYGVKKSTQEFVPGEILVKFKEGTTDDVRGRINKKFGVIPAKEIIHMIKKGDTLGKLAGEHLGDADFWKVIRDKNKIDPLKLKTGQKIKMPSLKKSRIKRILVDHLKIPKTRTVPELVKLYEEEPDVIYAEPDYLRWASVMPNDPRSQLSTNSTNQWHINHSTTGYIYALEAWDIQKGTDNPATVASIDTGFNLNHADLQDVFWVNSDEIANNGIDDDGNGYIDDSKYGYNFYSGSTSPAHGDGVKKSDHGTGTAGLFAAITNNSLGIAGIAGGWDSANGVKLMVMNAYNDDTGGFPTSATAEAAIYAADNGADIITMSYGGTSPSKTGADAYKYAWDQGCLLIAASGNTDYGKGEEAQYPANYSSVMSVGGTDLWDYRIDTTRWHPGVFSTEWESGYGQYLEIVAPGYNVMSSSGLTGTGGYRSASGTSYSAPLVAGVAALCLSEDPTLTNSALRAILKDSADDMIGWSGEDTAGWDKYYGWGRLNAERALLKVATADGSGAVTTTTQGLNKGTSGNSLTITFTGLSHVPVKQWEIEVSTNFSWTGNPADITNLSGGCQTATKEVKGAGTTADPYRIILTGCLIDADGAFTTGEITITNLTTPSQTGTYIWKSKSADTNTETPTLLDSGRQLRVQVLNYKSLPWTDDMETGGAAANGEWGTYSNVSTEWELGTPITAQANPQYKSASKCWGTDLDANYVLNADVRLTSPYIDLTNATKPQMSFWQYIDPEGTTSAFDGGLLYVSIDLGKTWTQVPDANITPDYLEPDYDKAITGTTNPYKPKWAWTHDHTPWEKVTVDLNAYKGNIVAFRFIFSSDGSVFAPGWFIDDIEAKEAPSDGSGIVSASPSTVTQGVGGYDLTFTLTANSINPVTGWRFVMNSNFGWSQTSADVIDFTGGLAAASYSVSGNTITFTNCNIDADGTYTTGSFIVKNATAPSTVGSYTFISRTAGDGGTLTDLDSSNLASIYVSSPTFSGNYWVKILAILDDGPTADEMKSFDVVIWEFGDTNSGLDSDEIKAVKKSTATVKFLFAGEWVPYHYYGGTAEEQNFCKEILGIFTSASGYQPPTALDGKAGTIGDGLIDIPLTDPAGGVTANFTAILAEPFDVYSSTGFVYDANANNEFGVERSKDALKTVTLGFAYEGFGTRENRSTLMKQIINYLDSSATKVLLVADDAECGREANYKTALEDIGFTEASWSELIINEIMYNPFASDDYYEYVELYNPSSNSYDLTGYKLKVNNDSYSIEVDTTHAGSSAVIQSHGYAIVGIKTSGANHIYDGTYPTIHAYDSTHIRFQVNNASLNLPNTDGTVYLIDSNGLTVDQVHYYDTWGANGDGNALECKNPANDNNVSTNWSNNSLTPNFVNSGYTGTDYTAPGKVTGLSALTGGTAGAVQLQWTAPGDDTYSGTAYAYMIWYNVNPVTDSNWASSNNVSPSPPSPLSAGTTQSMTVQNLSGNTTYYFAMKASDEAGNWSVISDTASATSGPDGTAPEATTQLSALTGTDHGTISLTWTSPHEDGTEGGRVTSYDLRYATKTFAEANWDDSWVLQATGEPTPAKYPETEETVVLTSLTGGTSYWFAMKSQDESDNISPIDINTADGNQSWAWAQNDTIKPYAITTLSALTGDNQGQVNLSWIAPGDDGTQPGTASSYDVRYATASFDNSKWDDSFVIQASGEPTPSAAGTSESMTVGSLTPDATYYFALKTDDDNPANTSDISNSGWAKARKPFDVWIPTAAVSATLSNINSSNGVAETVAHLDIIDVTGWDHTLPAGAINISVVFGLEVDITDAAFEWHIYTNTGTGFVKKTIWDPDGAPGTFEYAMADMDTLEEVNALDIRVEGIENPDAGAPDDGTVDFIYLEVEYESETTPPSAITNLSALTGGAAGAVQLQWTAPGDDGTTGTATSYDVKYATFSVLTIGTTAWWNGATDALGEPAPSVSGTSESMTVAYLTAGTTYYFGIKATDEADNQSIIDKNAEDSITQAKACAYQDSISPAAITNLSALTGTSEGEVKLNWTASGDDGTVGKNLGGKYEVRYATYSVEVSTTPNWWAEAGTAGRVKWFYTPLDVGEEEERTVAGLSQGVTYYFAIKSYDSTDNASEIDDNGWDFNTQAWARAQGDTTAPATIKNLTALQGPGAGWITLEWTIPGDDGTVGNNTSGSYYTVKYASYSTQLLASNATDWWNYSYTLTYSQSWTVGAQGVADSRDLIGFTSGTTYWFAIRTTDNAGNQSAIDDNAMDYTTQASTVASGDTYPPAKTNTFSASSKAYYPGQIDLTWTSTGDNGWDGNIVNGEFKIQYSTYVISWSTANANISIDIPDKSPGAGNTRTVTGLTPGKEYYFRIWTRDEVPNWSSLSVGATAYATNYKAIVDGNPQEWRWGGADPPAGTMVNQVFCSSWTWVDKTGDMRDDGTVDSNYDITQIQITADATYIYFMIKFSSITDMNETYVGIALDTDADNTDTALTWFADDSETGLGDEYYENANYHYGEKNIIFHNSTAGNSVIELHDGGTWFAPPTGDHTITISQANHIVEARINRADLGLSGAATTKITVASYDNVVGWANDVDTTFNYNGTNSDALDSMSIVRMSQGGSTYNDPYNNMSSWDEDISDNDIDFWADIRFAANGDISNTAPSAPSLTSPGDGNIINDLTPTLKWEASSDSDSGDAVTSYMVELATYSTFGDTVTWRVNVSSSTTEFTIPTDLPTPTTYYWRVKSRDKVGGLSDNSTYYFVIKSTQLHVVIAKFGEDYQDETASDWVQLYNPTNQNIILTGSSLQNFTSALTADVNVIAGTIPAYGFFLFGDADSLNMASMLDGSDATWVISDDKCIVYASNNVAITGVDDPDIVDLIGLGVHPWFEGTATVDILPDRSHERLSRAGDVSANLLPGGSREVFGNQYDTNDNSVDIIQHAIDTRYPQCSKSPHEIPEPPQISYFSPTSGSAGTQVDIYGYYFGAVRVSSNAYSHVYFYNNVEVTSYVSWSDTHVVVQVPSGASTGTIWFCTQDDFIGHTGTSTVEFGVPAPTTNPPDAPTLGDNQYTSSWATINTGDWTNQTVIRASFTITDPDAGENLRYMIQFSTYANFSFCYINSTRPAVASGLWLSEGPTNFITNLVETTLPDGTWYWKVAAIDDSGDSSAYSSHTVVNGCHFRIDTSSPAAVTGFTASSGNGVEDYGKITLEWTSPTDSNYKVMDSSYTIKYATYAAPGSPPSQAQLDKWWTDSTLAFSTATPSAPGTAEVHTITGLTAGSTLYWAIKTNDELSNLSAIDTMTASGTQVWARVPATYHIPLCDGATAEWSISTEQMGTDAGDNLLITWSSAALHISWVGCAFSGADDNTGAGDFFIVIDTDTNSGSATSVDWNGAGTHTLPFKANYSIGIDRSGNKGYSYWNGAWTWGGWPTGWASYIGNAGNDKTEISIELSDIGNPDVIKLVVYAQWESARNVFASFPTENPASAADVSETFTYYYDFTNLNDLQYPNEFPTVESNVAPTAPTAHAQFVNGWTSLNFGEWTQYQTLRATFTLTDNNAGDTLQFNIQFSTHSDFSFCKVNSTSPATATLAPGATNYITELLPEGTWYWRVMATDNGGLSGPYSSYSLVGIDCHFGIDTTDPPTPAAPGLARADNMRPRIDLSWTKVEDLLSGTSNYLIYRATFSFTSVGEANVSYAGTVDHPTESYNDTTNLLPNTTYFYCIAARDCAGNTAKSANSSKRTARIDIDGELTDWSTSVTAPKINASTVTLVTTKGDVSYCEWIWRDKPDDERNNGTIPDSQYDIRDIRITADEEYLYFYFTVEDYSDKDRINFAVAIDTNQSTTDSTLGWIGDDSNSDANGGAAMALGDEYSLNAAAHYAESILHFRYISALATDFRIAIYRKNASGWDDPPVGGAGAGATYFSDGNNFFEAKVQRSDLGLTGEKTMRFSICNFDNVVGLIGDVDSTGGAGYNPDALDSMSIVRISSGSGTGQYHSDPANDLNSWEEEISDSDIDFWAEVRLAADGLISNTAPNIPTKDAPTNEQYSTNAKPVLSWNAATDPDSGDGDYVTSYMIEFATHSDLGSN